MSSLPIAAAPPRVERTLRPHPSKLFVEVTTRCNLQCAMCVKQAPDGGVLNGDLSEALFAKLEPALPTLETLVLNGIGEPLLHPGLEGFVERAKAAMPARSDVAFQTNGTLLNPVRAERLVRAGIDRVCVSMDAVTPGLAARLRAGAELATVQRAFAVLADAKRRLGRARPAVGLEFVLVRENAAELPEVISWAAARGVSFVIVTQMLPYGPGSVASAAYRTSSAEAIALFERWQAKAAEAGLDLRHHAGAFTKTKFNRPAGEDRAVPFAEGLLAEARERGMLLRLDDLLRDDPFPQQVEALLDEARVRAAAHGIALTLPRLAPSAERACDFVEDGAAFVSWDGKIHPCYFLWHKFGCHVGGLEKRVKPVVLGDLRDGDILAAWNGERFRRFRQAVVRYDFPRCYDCRLALCDLSREEEFREDCYAGDVPCGACLWCTGLFHCLR